MKYPFLLVCCLFAASAAARPSPSLAAPAPGPAPAASQVTVSLELLNTPLQQALELLFSQAGYQYVIQPDVPRDLPITMEVKEAPFAAALHTLLRLATASIPAPGSVATRELIYRKEGEVYVIGMRQVAPPGQPAYGVPAPTRPAPVIEKIPVSFLRPSDAVTYLTQQQMPQGIVSMQPLSRDNSLVVRGDPDAIQQLKRLLQLADVPPRMLFVSAGISGPGVNGRPLAIRSSARSLVGDDVTIDEQAVIGGQPAHMKVTLNRTQLLGNGELQVASDWDVSMPVAGGPRGPIRLVKRLSTTTLLRPGEQVPVAEVDLSGWGGKGVLSLWIRGEWERAGVRG